jgi:hypothetical protein
VVVCVSAELDEVYDRSSAWSSQQVHFDDKH